MSTTTAAPGSIGASNQLQFSGTGNRRSGSGATTICAPSVLGRCGCEVARLDALDHCGIGERGRVAELLVFGHVPQEAPHDLAGARLWKVFGEQDRLGL